MWIFIAIILINSLQQLIIYVMRLQKNKLSNINMTPLQNDSFDK